MAPDEARGRDSAPSMSQQDLQPSTGISGAEGREPAEGPSLPRFVPLEEGQGYERLPVASPVGQEAEGPLVDLPTGNVAVGIPTTDIEYIKAIRRVVTGCALAVTFYIVSFIWQLLSGVFNSSDSNQSSLWSGFSQLVIELGMPCCGYYGAVQGHRTLVFFYCGANLLFVAACSVSFFRITITFSNACDGDLFNSGSNCQNSSTGRYTALINLAILALISIASVVLGRNLYKALGPVETRQVGMNSTPLVGIVVQDAQSHVVVPIEPDTPPNPEQPATATTEPSSPSGQAEPSRPSGQE